MIGPTGRNSENDLLKFSTKSDYRASNRSSKRSSSRTHSYSTLPRKGNPGLLPSIVRDLIKTRSKATVSSDTSDLIVDTNDLIQDMYVELETASSSTESTEILAIVATSLQSAWRPWIRQHRQPNDDLLIGPGPDATDLENAYYLATLMFQLYNPSPAGGSDAEAMSGSEILLGWLNEHQAGYEASYTQVISTKPNVTASEFFWDMISLLTARGRLGQVQQLFEQADFSYAHIDNGTEVVPANYSGTQLQAIHQAIRDAQHVLAQCPALSDSNWRLDSPDWIAFRRDLEDVLDVLTDAVESDDEATLYDQSRLDALVAVRAGKQRRGLPYDIYIRLLEMYHILLGSTPDLLAVSGDWLEASLLLTIWWNKGTENQITQWSFDVSRAQDSSVDDRMGMQAYLQRLKDSFLCVTDPSMNDAVNRLNSCSALEVAIGCILQSDIPSALRLMQTYSLPVCAALAEVGSTSGWFGSAKAVAGLDEEDLMVLTTRDSQPCITHDGILTHYSRAVFEGGELLLQDGRVVEGFQVAFSILARLDDMTLSRGLVNEMLDELEINTVARAERLVTTLNELNMPSESRKVSEAFGDYLVKDSTAYGKALLCYARAHSEHKVRQLVDLLTSYCLVQSRAFPPEEEMDPALSNLVSNPRQALAAMSEVDPQAVETMQFHLVGYACVRRFYSTRDSGDLSVSARRKACAGPLVAALNSAADCIYGGLYDPERQSAIQIDSLLPLLGEVTALLSEESTTDESTKRVFSSKQFYDILSAIEDLSVVSARVFAATEECLLASLRNYSGSQPPSPHAMLKKSMSSGTSTNFSFSMIGSEMLTRSNESLDSAVLVGKDKAQTTDGVQRGWDWRQAFVQDGKDGASKGQEVIRVLRLAIAKELSLVDLEEGVL